MGVGSMSKAKGLLEDWAYEDVVVGGVRRSAMISLSNLSDDRMRHAKSGNWWENQVHRALANNSVAYTEKYNSRPITRSLKTLALIVY